jgi:hypothetical protein
MNVMDIIILNIDPTAVKKFDELAKEKGFHDKNS